MLNSFVPLWVYPFFLSLPCIPRFHFFGRHFLCGLAGKHPLPQSLLSFFLRTSKLLEDSGCAVFIWVCSVHVLDGWWVNDVPVIPYTRATMTFLYCTSVWKSNFTIHLLFSLLSVLWDGIYCYHFTVTCKWLVSCSNLPKVSLLVCGVSCFIHLLASVHGALPVCLQNKDCLWRFPWEADLIPAETQHFNEQF